MTNRSDVSAELELLKPIHREFVRRYLSHGIGSKAVIEAGYRTSGNAAAAQAYKLLARPDIQKAITAECQRAQNAANYDRDAALKEIHANMQLALDADQHTAASRYQELKVKLMGLLVDRIDLRSTQQVVLNLPDRAALGIEHGITIESEQAVEDE